ncbi:a6d9ed9e-7d00-4ecc-a226-2f5857aa2d31 [Thermothielavioides terrestris]|uniref:A6d9ed9e-7d00-4ecc-a226-2f5857aa2d31 n=1 Tax=Thermothielavioides terrestris TaxID=2587410 RepID=A0A3S4ANP0_9PEZI|nr:a6d9ed9e-7d00-4ecc-a226-2f5857aa2d31 [Thermothielavioides terrestris]
MCYQLIELYSACRCLYYQHAVDREHSSHHASGYDYSYSQYSDSGYYSGQSSKSSGGRYR